MLRIWGFRQIHVWFGNVRRSGCKAPTCEGKSDFRPNFFPRTEGALLGLAFGPFLRTFICSRILVAANPRHCGGLGPF